MSSAATAQQQQSETALQLKSAIYLMVAKMVEQQQSEHRVGATPTFVASLVEIVYNQIVNLGEDLELFAQHAGRSVIKPNDLYMVTRKNDTLTSILKHFEAEIKRQSSQA